MNETNKYDKRLLTEMRPTWNSAWCRLAGIASRIPVYRTVFSALYPPIVQALIWLPKYLCCGPLIAFQMAVTQRSNVGGRVSESDSILHEQVAKLAYEIWESKGRPAGTAEIDWLEAEEFLEFGDPEKPPFQSIAAFSGAEAQPGSETSYMHLTEEEGAKQHPTSELMATRGLNI